MEQEHIHHPEKHTLDEAVYFAKPGAYKAKKILKMFLLYLLLVIQGIIVVLPFYIMILTSVKNGSSLALSTHFQWFVPFKEAIQNAVSNYTSAYAKINFGRSVLNTLLTAFITTSGMIITTVLAAFAFSRLSFKGRDILFSLFMTTMMVPGEMFIITNYMTVGSFGWLGTAITQTYMDAILCETIPFMTSIFYIYYLRQTFKTIPNELYYAAKVDGTSDFKYLLKVMIPIASGTIVSIIILNAMSSWNAYIWPTLVTNNQNYRLVTAALRNASFIVNDASNGLPDYTRQMAASVMVTVPLLIVFFALKKYIMRGVSRSGIKG